MKKKYGWREFLFDVHLWLGLGSGIVIVLLCFTGFILALQPVLKASTNKEVRYRAAPEATILPLEQMVAQVTNKTAASALEIPADPKLNWKLYEGRNAIYIDPATGETLGQEGAFLDGLYRTSFRLHRWLLLDSSIGRPITGVATLFFLVILVSGLILWFQKCWNKWRRGLLLKRKVGWKRLNYDLHLVLGFYTLIPLFIMGFSGLFWSNRPIFNRVVYAVLDQTSPPERGGRQNRRRGGQDEQVRNYQLPYSQILASVSPADSKGSIRIDFPAQGDKTLSVSVTRPAGFWSVPGRDRYTVDSTSGEIVESDLFADKTRAEKFLSQIKAIHIGEVWGNFSLVLYLIASFLGTTLPITGVVMWWNRVGRRWWRTKRDSLSTGR